MKEQLSTFRSQILGSQTQGAYSKKIWNRSCRSRCLSNGNASSG
ncbi:hypothetical protein Hanom_Chr03g00231181 [Helianthus anomalus]